MEYQEEFDVVVVGFGAAGANAAIAAHDAGARVLLLEKLAAGGGNSALCAEAMTIPRDVEGAVEYYRNLSFGTVDEEMVRAFAEAMAGIPELLQRLDIPYEQTPRRYPFYREFTSGGFDQFGVHLNGARGFQLLEQRVKERDIEIRYNVSATSLIQRPGSREVMGLKVGCQDKHHEISIRANRAVILTCGGYEYDSQMLANHNFPGVTDYIFPWGTPGNTGDGVRMVTAAGAALWHMASIEWGRICACTPSREFGTVIGYYELARLMAEKNYLFVNSAGTRFMAEDTRLTHRKEDMEFLEFDQSTGRHINLPAFMIFDERTRVAATEKAIADNNERRKVLVGYADATGLYDWSVSYEKEIANGWIIRADSLAELANKLGIDESGLQATLVRYNEGCAHQLDPDFGRNANGMEPVHSPPYYGVELGLSLVNTQGGPKRNAASQVLDYRDQPIPRLYAAGELGSFFGFLYQGGSNYPEAWAFGQIAGQNAAAETPLTRAGSQCLV